MISDYEAAVHPTVKVILEQGPRNWSAYVPSVPGCIATGANREAVMRNIEDALTFHLQGLHEDEIARECAAQPVNNS